MVRFQGGNIIFDVDDWDDDYDYDDINPFTPGENTVVQKELMRLVRLQGGTIIDDVEAKKPYKC